ncbi:inovirus-type Gp2 protein [Enterobacter asburiae]|uniref:Inovirus-type Gp2 protein n=1 Tax=Enterobacter asburiae TaxID=61645 RepID=A0AAW7ZM88_ENTAS|nr:inovirus-type Gp2 protein [Enterobacter asburiae]MCL8160724.1 inovirus Gp2 family protein [Enterobacter asburiae]MCM7940945.1 inovirus Gp2 family protein [Enterobacter asburiae]MDO7920845.1 inovirus-type Gp2 protein [Enterobacter asburiae]MDV0916077.1 inovirus-type Gp2 protein [Enterobacter asburiae]MDV0936042.1 inovirus-type Gp2 protein [Enterobacter asburiae]
MLNPPIIPRYTMDWYLLSNINHHIDMMIKRYSCLYALRIDLFYRKDTYRYISSNIQSMEGEIRSLMAEMNKSPAVVGYFCVMEWTADHGFHIHAVLWLDGHITQKPFVWAEKANAAWAWITQGEGHLYRCEKKEAYAADVSIPVRYNDAASIANIRYILSYLAKENQKEGLCWHYCNEVPERPSAGRPRRPAASPD